LRRAPLAAVLAALAEPDPARAPRIVGGAVRDCLAGRAVKDVDIATPLPPEAVMARLAAAGIKAVPTGLAHGTVTAVAAGAPFEITTLRRDVATDGRHAEVAFTDDWRADAARRDFTINALSMTARGAVFDYFGGLADLAAGRVRFVGDAPARVAEDYLRILRFFRFHARYGRGAPDRRAVAAIRGGLAGLDRLSAERVWMELKALLALPDPARALALMQRLGVLPALLAEARDDAPARLAALVRSGAPADPLLRLAAMLPDGRAGAAVAARLKLSSAEAASLAALLEAPGTLAPAQDDAALRRLLAGHDKAALIGAAWLAEIGQGPRRGAAWRAMRARIVAMIPPAFPLQGRDLLRAGMAPGPAVGAMLAALRDWWLAGGCTATRAECLAQLARRRAVKGS